MKVKIGGGYRNEDGTFAHNVTIDQEEFKNVPNIPKYKHCDNSNCKYYSKCSCNDGVVRPFDCIKNRNIVIQLYNTVTGAFVAMSFYNIFVVRHMGFFKGTGVLLITMVVLDIGCSIFEDAVPKIRDAHFYKKLKRADKRLEEKKRKEEEAEKAKKITDEFTKMVDVPYYQEIVNADASVNSLKKLSDEYDFGASNDKIKECVNKLSQIIKVLKQDSSSYGRVAFLFEGSLDKLFNTLRMYTYFIETKTEDPKYEQLLEACIDSFLRYLKDQKVEAIFDKSSVEDQFRSSAEALRKMVERKGED